MTISDNYKSTHMKGIIIERNILLFLLFYFFTSKQMFLKEMFQHSVIHAIKSSDEKVNRYLVVEKKIQEQND